MEALGEQVWGLVADSIVSAYLLCWELLLVILTQYVAVSRNREENRRSE